MFSIDIKGNLESLKSSIINEIEEIYDFEISKDDFLPPYLAEKMAEITGKINRELAVFIDRKGNIADISVGDSSTVSLPQVDGRRDTARLCGIRCIHTHPKGDGMVSLVDLNSLLKLRLDAMVAIGVEDGKVSSIYGAIPERDEEGQYTKSRVYGPYNNGDSSINLLWDSIYDSDKISGTGVYDNVGTKEKAILVGLDCGSSGASEAYFGKGRGEIYLDELEELAKTAGAIVVKKVLQRKSVKDSAYYIGRGKIEEIALIRQALNADLVIFDDELSGAQVRNIEEAVGAKVIDRTSLILDIFAQRARSKEGKLQVELAQLKYRVSRLIGLGTQLSRLGGGIGTRGPGEKKLEVDRRHIRRRIKFLEAQLSDVEKRRNFHRSGRDKNKMPVIALVGYTNAGKSTLMNSLCNCSVFAEDKLFATLDPTTRKLELKEGREAFLVDTVGFIRKLPHELVEAFKSTLEEVLYADLLLHVADMSSPEVEEQIEVVNSILGSLGVVNKPSIMVLNKKDLASEDKRIALDKMKVKAYEISAVNGDGIDELLLGIKEALPLEEVKLDLFIPYKDGWVIPYLHQNGKILSEEHVENGTKVRAVISNTKKVQLDEYIM